MDRAAPPTWLEELVELLHARRRLAAAVAVGVAVLGVLVALVAPGLLPATAGVGAAVGLAGVLLGVAAVLGIDAGDLEVLGARHVRAAGADVAVVLRGPADGDGATAVIDRLDDEAVTRVALVPADPASRDEVGSVADGLGQAWARAGRRVLVADLTRSDHEHDGIVEVVRGEAPLGQAVRFDDELMLARLGAGADLEVALVELPGLVPRLPGDIERAVIALPPLVDPAARTGATAGDEVLVVAIVGRTSRVDLLATLEALDVVGVDARVLLHRPDDELPPVLGRVASAAGAEPDAVRESPEPVVAPETDDPSDERGVPAADVGHDDDLGIRPPWDEEPVEDAGLPETDDPDRTQPHEPVRAVVDGPGHARLDDDTLDDTGPLPPVAAEEEAPDPVSATSDVGDQPVAPPEHDGSSRTLAGPPPDAPLGLADFEREIEQEARAGEGAGEDDHAFERQESPDSREAPDLHEDTREHLAAPAAYDEEPAAVDPSPPRPADLRPSTSAAADGGEALVAEPREAHDVLVADDPQDPAADEGTDELTTTAVLEALAREIWARDEAGST